MELLVVELLALDRGAHQHRGQVVGRVAPLGLDQLLAVFVEFAMQPFAHHATILARFGEPHGVDIEQGIGPAVDVGPVAGVQAKNRADGHKR